MSHESEPPGPYTLNDLLDYWQRSELTMEEVVRHWPPPAATRKEVARELLRMILGFHARMAAIDGIGEW